jgi:hypothetical protein
MFKESGKITGYDFQFGDLGFHLIHEDAKKIYNYLDSTNMFGIDTIKTDTSNSSNIIFNVGIEIDGQTLGLELIELKDLYYVLKDLFKKEMPTIR